MQLREYLWKVHSVANVNVCSVEGNEITSYQCAFSDVIDQLLWLIMVNVRSDKMCSSHQAVPDDSLLMSNF